MKFEEVNDALINFNKKQRDFKIGLKQFLSDVGYKSKNVRVENDKIRIETYGKRITDNILQEIQEKSGLRLTAKEEILSFNISEKHSYLPSGECEIFRYTFRKR